jgi:hypothetical protein
MTYSGMRGNFTLSHFRFPTNAFTYPALMLVLVRWYNVSLMTYKIISPTGASVTKTFTEQEVAKIKSLQYFQVVPLTVHRIENHCLACEG